MNEALSSSSLVEGDLPTVLYVWAPWCAPCRGMSPQIDRLRGLYEGRVRVRKLNADEHPAEVRALRVFGIPTVIVLRDGQPVARKTGALSGPALEAVFSSAERGETVQAHGLRLSDRLVRGLAGLALGVIGWSAGPSWILVALAGAIAFSAIYDRCPVWQALTHWVKNAFSSS